MSCVAWVRQRKHTAQLRWRRCRLGLFGDEAKVHTAATLPLRPRLRHAATTSQWAVDDRERTELEGSNASRAPSGEENSDAHSDDSDKLPFLIKTWEV